MSATNTGETETLDWWSQKWDELALSTADPGEDGTGLTEPVGNGYARFALNGTQWGAAVAGDPSSVANDVEIEFPAASGGNWGTVSHIALIEAGTIKHYGALTVPVGISDGDILRFAVAAISITQD